MWLMDRQELDCAEGQDQGLGEFGGLLTELDMGQVLLATQIWSDLLPHQFGSCSHWPFTYCLHPGGHYQPFTLPGFSWTGRPQSKVRLMDLEITGFRNVPSQPVTKEFHLPCHRTLIQVLGARSWLLSERGWASQDHPGVSNFSTSLAEL